jgi:hypothetical protein
VFAFPFWALKGVGIETLPPSLPRPYTVSTNLWRESLFVRRKWEWALLLGVQGRRSRVSGDPG